MARSKRGEGKKNGSVQVFIDKVSANYIDEILKTNHLYKDRKHVVDIAISYFYDFQTHNINSGSTTSITPMKTSSATTEAQEDEDARN